MFSLLRRNLSKCSPVIKASSSLIIVQPIIEYAAVAWGSYYLNDIQALEKIQRRAAQWLMKDYNM